MNFKKILSTLLSAVLITGVFCGCSQKVEKTDDIPVIRWLVAWDEPKDLQMVTDEINKYLVDKIGAKLQLEFIDSGAYAEKMNMYMASSEPFDIAFAGYIVDYKKSADKGGILCLDDYLDKFPALKEAIPEYAWETVKYNNKIYAIPNVQILPTAKAVVVKRMWTDKYNFDYSNVKTVDDMEPFMEIIKQNEPDRYPFYQGLGINCFDYVDDYDPVAKHFYGKEDENGNYKISLMYETEEYKKAVWKLRDWYEKGYIRKDVASVVDTSTDSKAGKYIVSQATYKPGMEAEYLSQGTDMVCIPVTAPIINNNTATTIIGKNSKHPEKALELLQLVNTDKYLFNLLTLGIEGVHYEKIGENKMRFLGTFGENGYHLNIAWMFGNVFNSYIKEEAPEDVWEQTDKFNRSARINRLMGFTLDDKNIRTELAQMESIASEYSALKNGAIDPEDYYDEFITRMHNAGSEKVCAEIQKQVDEYLKNTSN